ncbi:putative enoyl-CoA hydratase echA14 [Mycobacteroides salmoniphilum]|nr:putative enoyl-CoA hydratase echA14 [Mycobacteroides salmoniphilum]TDZ88276.1 putative enoyl-CoA hydratase echA14 [Mycobacteroides salmoniphilum]
MIRTEHRDNGILVVTIDRPERRNALDPQTVAELHSVVDKADGDPKVRVVILTAVGASFCAGADLKSLPTDFTNTGVTSTAALLVPPTRSWCAHLRPRSSWPRCSNGFTGCVSR